MYELIKKKGVAAAKSLYGKAGGEVIGVYESSIKDEKTSSETKEAMLAKINELGPTNISTHVVGSDGVLCVFDVDPASIGATGARKRFSNAVKAHKSIKRFFEPPNDPAFHLEVIN